MSTSPLLHPFSPPATSEADYLKIVRGEGALVYDDHGKAYIDGIGNLWLSQVGHGRPELAAAIADQLNDLECYNLFYPFTSPVAEKAAGMIAARSPHPEGRVFLGCSGSEAVDTVLKIARLIHQLRGDHDRQIIIKREGGYHGTNVGGTSVQGMTPNREGWGDLLPHVVEVPRDDLAAFEAIFEEHGDRVAAVLTEPVQGASGVFPPSEGYLEGIRRLCDEHGALLIFDEVITGFGRTGNWFAAQHYGVTPDLMSFAKGATSGYLPLSGVIVSRALCDELEADPDFIFRHGFTYTGHQASCAAAIANIELIEQEGLVDRAKHIGEKIAARLEELENDGLIESFRGVGGIWAAEIGRDAVPVRAAMLDDGVIMRPIGTCLAMCPPLVITDDEIDTMIDALGKALAGTQ